jgi:hypothetical protein
MFGLFPANLEPHRMTTVAQGIPDFLETAGLREAALA